MKQINFLRSIRSIPIKHPRRLGSIPRTIPIEVTLDGKVATLRLVSGPANVLTLDTVRAMRSTLKKLESDREVEVLVITAGKDGVFSAGLDLKELYSPDRDRLKSYWAEVQSLMTDLYGTHLGTVARMNGHSIAAGCIIGLMCDYRILVENGKVGLNEAALGMTMPWWITRALEKIVGTRHAERMVSLALLPCAKEAKIIGLVDHG